MWLRHSRQRLREVANTIIEGLRDGTIVPDPPLMPDQPLENDPGEALPQEESCELRKTFAALKAVREQRGLSITDLAERTGIDRAMISRLENGQIDNPTIATMSRYAKGLGKKVVVSLVEAAEE
jgi:ribosome-binding protein aMBF1 (putative translation factor)